MNIECNWNSIEIALNTFVDDLCSYTISYSKSAILETNYSTWEDFLDLISLKHFKFYNLLEIYKGEYP